MVNCERRNVVLNFEKHEKIGEEVIFFYVSISIIIMTYENFFWDEDKWTFPIIGTRISFLH